MFTKKVNLGKKVVVIGAGSIGTRHARILEDLGCQVTVVSRHLPEGKGVLRDVGPALTELGPDYVLIANETSLHFETLAQVREIGYEGPILVEKPLFKDPLPRDAGAAEAVQTIQPINNIFVGYNLRFHPLLRKLKEMVNAQRVVSVQAYVGKYLPDWRPETDHRQSYSASKDKGGGVLRDLSHELDYIMWIFGDWQAAAASGGHLSALEIETEDVFDILLTTERAESVSIHLDYLDRIGRRHVFVNTESETIWVDLLNGTIRRGADVASFEIERDLTYREMHLSLLTGHADPACSFTEGVRVMELIAACERAAAERTWVNA